MTKPLLILALISALPCLAQETVHPAAPIYMEATETEALMAKDGQKVVVYGNTKSSGKSGSGTNFVNFEDADFYLITFKSDLTEFKEGEPVDLYDGKRIAVTGVISVYKGKPQIKLTDPSTVQILEADAVFPPKVEDGGKDAKPAAPAAEKKAKPETKPATPEEAKKKPPVDPKKYFK